jgi:hypothetical protein
MRLAHAYGWSVNHIRKEITSAQGWVYYNWALENEASVWGDRLDRKSDGYVKQERKKIFKELMN